MQEKVAKDPRYVSARKRIAKLFGRDYESRDEAQQKAHVRAEKVAAAAATTAGTKKTDGALGDPTVKAQIYGKRSCPWSGRAITLLERHKVDFDWIDLEEPEHEAKLVPLANETKQNTVPFVYLRGQFVGSGRGQMDHFPLATSVPPHPNPPPKSGGWLSSPRNNSPSPICGEGVGGRGETRGRWR